MAEKFWCSHQVFFSSIHKVPWKHLFLHLHWSPDVTDGSHDQFTSSINESLHFNWAEGGIHIFSINIRKNVTAIIGSKRTETNSFKSPRTTFTAFALHTTQRKQATEWERERELVGVHGLEVLLGPERQMCLLFQDLYVRKKQGRNRRVENKNTTVWFFFPG